MDIYLLDESLRRIGIVEDYVSSLWVRRFFEPGEVDITISAKNPISADILGDRFLENRTVGETFVIDTVSYETDFDDPKKVDGLLTVKGRTLDSILTRRMIYSEMVFDGLPIQTCVNSIFETHVINPQDPNRKLERFRFESVDLLDIDPILVTDALDGVNVLEGISRLLEAHDLGYSVHVENGLFVFRIEKSLDKSKTNNREPIIFSDELQNVFDTRYLANQTGLRNRVYIRNYEDTLPVSPLDSAGMDLREGFFLTSVYDRTDDPTDPPDPPTPPKPPVIVIPPLPDLPPEVPPIFDPEKLGVGSIYILTSSNRVLVCPNPDALLLQSWKDITPVGDVVFTNLFVDWNTGACYGFYANIVWCSQPSGTSGPDSNPQMTPLYYAKDYLMGGVPDDNGFYGSLGDINPMTGEILFVVTNPTVGNGWSYYGVVPGELEKGGNQNMSGGHMFCGYHVGNKLCLLTKRWGASQGVEVSYNGGGLWGDGGLTYTGGGFFRPSHIGPRVFHNRGMNIERGESQSDNFPTVITTEITGPGNIAKFDADMSDEHWMGYSSSELVFKSIDDGVTWIPAVENEIGKVTANIEWSGMEDGSDIWTFVVNDLGGFSSYFKITKDLGTTWTSSRKVQLSLQPLETITLVRVVLKERAI